jgi:hypothetical protein
MKYAELTPRHVEFMPVDLEQGILYISHEYGTAIHLCACGCGIKTVTGFKPFWEDGWNLTENGDLVTLHPSIGNQQFPCRSHYWIKDSKVIWC